MTRRGWITLICATVLLVPAAWWLLDTRLGGVAARLDRDGSGVLERDEVGPLAARRFAQVDRDGSDTVDGVEFRRWILRQWWQGRTGALRVPAEPAVASPAALREWIDGPVRRGELDGVAVILLRDGEVVFRHAAGDLDPAVAVPLADATTWVTAATFACLEERGELDLDAPLAAAEVGLPPRFDGLSLGAMLAHGAGTPADQVLALDPATSNAVAARILADTMPPAAGPPAFRYGAVSMQIAGAVAERLTGRAWRRLFVECLSWPLSLDSAAWGHPLAGPSRRGLAHLGAGLHMSLDDYGAFLAMLQQGGRYDGVQNLSAATVTAMFRDRLGTLPRDAVPAFADPAWHYALGAWCEAVDAAGGCTRLNAAGAFGAFPWLDRTTGVGGMILTVDALPRVRAWVLATRALGERVQATAAP